MSDGLFVYPTSRTLTPVERDKSLVTLFAGSILLYAICWSPKGSLFGVTLAVGSLLLDRGLAVFHSHPVKPFHIRERCDWIVGETEGERIAAFVVKGAFLALSLKFLGVKWGLYVLPMSCVAIYAIRSTYSAPLALRDKIIFFVRYLASYGVETIAFSQSGHFFSFLALSSARFGLTFIQEQRSPFIQPKSTI
jgi:hypothetical protein